MKQKYYSLKKILSYDATYNIIFGERSNGKTFAVHEYAIKQYCETGKQLALVRRWSEDFTGKRGNTMFDGIATTDLIEKLSKGKWTGVHYYGSKWYLCRFDEDGKKIIDEKPFCLAFSITSMEHDKSTSYPDVTTVLFDECITRKAYLPDEFVLFMNVLSTIIRRRTDVKIFMLGNTVNKYCPYFNEMGLKHLRNMKPGDIDIYRYGDSRLTVAVEYTEPNAGGKESDFYFAFDNPSLKMITGGAWEVDVYPHCPVKYRPCDIIFTYFIEFDGEMLQCEVVRTTDEFFTFIHRKTTPLQSPDKDLVFSTSYDAKPNWKRKITIADTELTKRLGAFFRNDKVFYQDNEVGEIIRNYLVWCGKIK